MDWNTAVSGFPSNTWRKNPGLQRMERLLSILGEPEFKKIQIAGSNGKGSVSQMTQKILTSSGFKTGLYISPHLKDFNERISIDGENIKDSEYIKIKEEVLNILEKYKSLYGDDDLPGIFELITLSAIIFFKENSCDIAVLETGLGGRLDATNAVSGTILSAITGISLEHTDVLGGTIQKIAHEKAGIIKPGASLAIQKMPPETEKIFLDRFFELNPPSDQAKLTEINSGSFHELNSFYESGSFSAMNSSCEADLLICGDTLSFRLFDQYQIVNYKNKYDSFNDIHLSLMGKYQRKNLSLVLDMVSLLRKRGLNIQDRAVRNALKNVTWPGRYEILSNDPYIILDGAHNPEGTMALMENLEETGIKEASLVMGVMKDKDFPEMLSISQEKAKRYIVTIPQKLSRALSEDELFNEARKSFSGPVLKAPDIISAVEKALSFPDPIVIFGSLYQVALVRDYLGKGENNENI